MGIQDARVLCTSRAIINSDVIQARQDDNGNFASNGDGQFHCIGVLQKNQNFGVCQLCPWVDRISRTLGEHTEWNGVVSWWGLADPDQGLDGQYFGLLVRGVEQDFGQTPCLSCGKPSGLQESGWGRESVFCRKQPEEEGWRSQLFRKDCRLSNRVPCEFDALAIRGLSAVATVSVCGPSLAELLVGRWQHEQEVPSGH